VQSTKNDPMEIAAKAPVPFKTPKERSDWINQYSYAKKLCEAHRTILSFLGGPSPIFEGREDEVEAVRQSLSKMRMRNCVLIGDPGVGKTEIMKKAISSLKTNDIFLNMDLASMLAGCKLVGMFEERFCNIVREVASANAKKSTRICFFIDEVHNLFRVGKSDQYGTLSGGEILKPYLAEGSIVVMGATTKEEYDKYVMADKALLRRLPPVFVDGMHDAQTAKIVESFAKGKMGPKIASYVVARSHWVHYLSNPDCALEIADRAIAKASSEGRKPNESDVDSVLAFMVVPNA